MDGKISGKKEVNKRFVLTSATVCRKRLRRSLFNKGCPKSILKWDKVNRESCVNNLSFRKIDGKRERKKGSLLSIVV